MALRRVRGSVLRLVLNRPVAIGVGALMLAQVAKLAQETQSGELPWDLVALVVLRLGLLNEPRFWPFTQALLLAAGERGRGHLLQGAHILDD